MSAQDLAENLDYAFLAREAMPWGKTVPWDTFLHYVLPHRTSQEPFQSHRAMLLANWPRCAPLPRTWRKHSCAWPNGAPSGQNTALPPAGTWA